MPFGLKADVQVCTQIIATTPLEILCRVTQECPYADNISGDISSEARIYGGR